MSLPSFRERLTTRIVALSMVSLLLVLTMIGGTLWLSWQLQGAGAAINDAGSLRMRAHALAIALMQHPVPSQPVLLFQIEQMNSTLDRLRKGDPARPLFLPDDTDVRRQFDYVADAWHRRLEPDVARPPSHRRRPRLLWLLDDRGRLRYLSASRSDRDHRDDVAFTASRKLVRRHSRW